MSLCLVQKNKIIYLHCTYQNVQHKKSESENDKQFFNLGLMNGVKFMFSWIVNCYSMYFP